MHAAAAIPAIGLLAGSAVGLVLPDIPLGFGLALLIACGVAAAWAWHAVRWRVLASTSCLVFFAGGQLLAAHAWRLAWRPPLRLVFEELARAERAHARRGTTLVGTVKSGALVEVIARGSALDEAMGSARAFSRRSIGDAVGQWSARSAGIVAAIVIGDRAGLDEDVQRALQEAGTYHVIAISGGNIAILAGLMLGAFRLAGLLGRTAMCAAIAVLVAYAYLVGGGASVDRATLMAVVYFSRRA